VAKGSLLPVAIYHWGRYLEKERLLEKRKRYVEQFTRAIEKSPEDACFHFLLANVLRDLGQTAEAILIYRKVIALSHDRVLSRQALERIAQIYFKNKKFSAAADAARELLAFDPENIYALNIFASLFLMSGRTDDAIEALHMVLAKTKNIEIEDPYQSQALPHLLLGEAYMHKNEKEKAELHLSYAKRVFPYLTGDN
jgi:tetratricopeptide (TPR) repeat protein